jgi:CHAT domain-containing protein
MCTAPSTRNAVFGLPDHPLYNPKMSTLFRKQLYKLLIPDQVLPKLDPDQPLVIVPHGILFSLPFHTLLAPDGQPLIHQAAVSYAPSLALLQALRHDPLEPAGHVTEEALVIGIENYNGRHPELRRAGNEARVVAAGLADPKTLLLNEAARRARLERMAGRYRLLHLATHGLFNSQHGLLSGIALADQDLRIDDLTRLGITAPLVVLSACETGLGIGDTLSNSRGVAGVFFALGARHVVATLWPADDSLTAGLMVAFYRELSSGVSPAVALARAQRNRSSLPVCHWASAACFGLP